MGADFEVAVVGAGCMGTSVAYHLAKAGVQTILIEQFELDHDRGSSYGGSRIFRLSYPHEVYVSLLVQAEEAWRAVERDGDCELLVTTGGLDLGRPDNPVFNACHESLTKLGVKHSLLDERALREKYPQFAVETGMVGLFQENAGILRASDCVLTMARLARSHGAVVKENTKCLELMAGDGYTRLVTDSGEITARKIVLTQGAWLGATLQKLDVSLELTVRKEQYLFFKALAANEFVTGRFPIFCEYNALGDDLDIQFYGFPIFENRSAMKMAFHQTGPITSAERRNFAIEEDRKQQLISFVERRFPEKFGEVVDGKTCLYTNTADRDFVFDFLPGRTDILVLSACSGHGFKFAPLFGKMAERLLRSEGHDDPLEVFSIERFAGIPR